MARHQHNAAPIPQGDPRDEAKRARLALIRSVNETPHVRVLPANDEMRRVLKHPRGWRGFPSDGGSVEWPLDRFTQRRLRDGDITIEDRQDKQPE